MRSHSMLKRVTSAVLAAALSMTSVMPSMATDIGQPAETAEASAPAAEEQHEESAPEQMPAVQEEKADEQPAGQAAEAEPSSEAQENQNAQAGEAVQEAEPETDAGDPDISVLPVHLHDLLRLRADLSVQKMEADRT